ncbi:MAG TPA: DUF1629 domain-containing protein [Gemmataceae bacterium]|nr:DUF1629 domain-containing protein [Gemmataceae bacterium]
MILIWRPDTNPDVWALASLTNYLDLCDKGLKANLAVPAPQPFPESTLEIETEAEPADFILAWSVFVVSKELRDCLEEFKVPAEYFQLRVIHKGKLYRKREYYFTNLLDVADCFDYEKSEYQRTPVGVTEIEKLVLDDSRATGHHLFILGPIGWAHSPNPKAVGDAIICASEELARRVLGLGLTGVVFSRPEHRRDYPPPAWRPPACA